MSARLFPPPHTHTRSFRALVMVSSICCSNCHRIGRKPPAASQTADKHHTTKDLSIISTMRERTRCPHFAVGCKCHTCSPHTALWWWMFASVCVCVCVKPCVTSAERVNVRLDDLWPDVSQIEVNAAAHDDESYQPPCFLLTDAPLSSASSVLWHRNVMTQQQRRYFTHCAAVSLWLEKHYH